MHRPAGLGIGPQHLWLALVGVLLTLCLTAVATAAEPAHPRLFVNADKIAGLRKAIAAYRSHHQQAYAALAGRASKGWAAYEPAGKYAPSYAAREAALMCVLASDPSKEDKSN